jgi:hypothetical protein
MEGRVKSGSDGPLFFLQMNSPLACPEGKEEREDYFGWRTAVLLGKRPEEAD